MYPIIIEVEDGRRIRSHFPLLLLWDEAQEKPIIYSASTQRYMDLALDVAVKSIERDQLYYPIQKALGIGK